MPPTEIDWTFIIAAEYRQRKSSFDRDLWHYLTGPSHCLSAGKGRHDRTWVKINYHMQCSILSAFFVYYDFEGVCCVRTACRTGGASRRTGAALTALNAAEKQPSSQEAFHCRSVV